VIVDAFKEMMEWNFGGSFGEWRRPGYDSRKEETMREQFQDAQRHGKKEATMREQFQDAQRHGKVADAD
jgi:hypothetical protein